MNEIWCEHGAPRGGHCSACERRVNHRYVSSMPLDGSRSIVHLKADGNNTRFRFISIERSKFVENGGFPANGRTDIIVIPLSFLEEDEGVTEDLVKEELSRLHGCSPDDITISVSLGWMDRRGFSEQGYRRKMRYSHGLNPDTPPPGWVQD